MRVIVTGGGGFLGRLLIEELQGEGFDEIVVIDIGDVEVAGCTVIQGDIAHEDILPELLADDSCTCLLYTSPSPRDS